MNSRITRSKKPGSYGAFLLAAYVAGTEESIKAEIKRAQDAGNALSTIDAVLKKLQNNNFWIRNNNGIKLTAKGLHFLRSHGLIDE